jgi:circadian clock protein KaiA
MREPALTIASLIRDPLLAQACGQWLRDGRVQLEAIDPGGDPVAALDGRREDFDAVLLEQGVLPPALSQALGDRGLLLPAVVIGAVTGRVEYHDAEVHLPPDQLEQLSYSIDAAVSRFLRRGLQAGGSALPGSPSPGAAGGQGAATHGAEAQGAGVSADRWKLANRLKGRLGYLGVYYKRDPRRYLRHLPEAGREELLRSLTRTYRDLLLSYFRDPAAANQALESFVHTAFFSDLPITNVVEIHMNLIESFSKQLKLEGHAPDFLQDYRLALLDVMAHICEMYRRSIPPDAPLGFELVPEESSAFQISSPPLPEELP